MSNQFKMGFATSLEESSIDAIRVQGALPPWLSGSLVRTGPARFEVGEQQLRHWFDGLARLDAFTFTDGRVSYASRFLDSRESRAAQDGKVSFREFATDPCRAIFSRFFSLFVDWTDNANVNVSRIGSRFVAMTETPLPIEFDPSTLETVGVVGFDDSLAAHTTTAHPHRDPSGDGLINYVARYSRRSRYHVYRLNGGSRRELIDTVTVKEPAYMHSFAVTDNYVVLAEFPLVVNPLRLLLLGRPFIENFRWKPERGTRFIVVNRRGEGQVVTYETGPFFAFHHVNAFEEGHEIVLDIAAYDDPSIIGALYLDVLRSDSPTIPKSYLRRYRLVPGKPSADYEPLSETPLELPRINYSQRHAKRYRFAYGASTKDGRTDEFLDQIAKVDLADGDAKVWREASCYPGEPVFVPAPGASAEDDGVVLSVVLDAARDVSFLLVLDGRSFTELGRAEVEQRLPFYFHGQYFPDVEAAS